MGTPCVTIHGGIVDQADVKRRNSAEVEMKLEETKTAEAVLTDPLVGRGVVDIDEHVLLRMPGEEPGENFDEFFLRRGVSLHKPLTDIETMRPFAAVESNPKSRPTDSGQVEPLAIFRNALLDRFEIGSLGEDKGWKEKCGC